MRIFKTTSGPGPFLADLHLHSLHSRATSPDMQPMGLWRWAQLKGIRVMGTGDFTHPEYLNLLKSTLTQSEEGLFTLKGTVSASIPDSCQGPVSFMLQAEVSSIYSKGGRTRKVHSIILAPDFTTVDKINKKLSAIGNLHSDGRPILGLDAKRLLEIVLECSDKAMVIPAHAWTPHFSVFGAMSGFDSLQECYDDLSQYIYAIETGLSSDPPMNRLVSGLDRLALISNSDAHSPSNVGREATVFECPVSYPAMMQAIKTRQGLWGTVEFFPEEGKYHMDGHRDCGVMLTPAQTRANGGKCPSCGKPVTIGVLSRVETLADRTEPAAANFKYTIPLGEIISHTISKGVKTKAVQGRYMEMVTALGPELYILLEAKVEDIARAAGEPIARAIENMRAGKVSLSPGFDGQYGVVRAVS